MTIDTEGLAEQLFTSIVADLLATDDDHPKVGVVVYGPNDAQLGIELQPDGDRFHVQVTMTTQDDAFVDELAADLTERAEAHPRLTGADITMGQFPEAFRTLTVYLAL